MFTSLVQPLKALRHRTLKPFHHWLRWHAKADGGNGVIRAKLRRNVPERKSGFCQTDGGFSLIEISAVTRANGGARAYQKNVSARCRKAGRCATEWRQFRPRERGAPDQPEPGPGARQRLLACAHPVY